MFEKLLENKALKIHKQSEFKLELNKTPGKIHPAVTYKGSPSGMLCSFATLVEVILKEDLIEAEVLHDTLMFIATQLGKGPHKDELK